MFRAPCLLAMPFTFSHPALVLPLLYARPRLRWLSVTGLVAGSIAPDFEKFGRLAVINQHSHSLASIFYFSCPVALLIAFVFHGLVRQPLLAHLPAALQQRLAPFGHLAWAPYLRAHLGGVLLSVVVGAALHLFWDSFTHNNTVVTDVLPGLMHWIRVGPWAGPWVLVLALISSVVGLLAQGWALWRLPRIVTGPEPTLRSIVRYWGTVAGVATVLVGAWGLAARPGLVRIGLAAITATLIGLMVASWLFRERKAEEL